MSYTLMKMMTDGLGVNVTFLFTFMIHRALVAGSIIIFARDIRYSTCLTLVRHPLGVVLPLNGHASDEELIRSCSHRRRNRKSSPENTLPESVDARLSFFYGRLVGARIDDAIVLDIAQDLALHPLKPWTPGPRSCRSGKGKSVWPPGQVALAGSKTYSSYPVRHVRESC